MEDKSKTNEKIPVEKNAETDDENRGPGLSSRRGFRRGLAMIVLVAGAAVIISYWSRMEKVDLTLVVKAAHGGSRIKRAEIVLIDKEGKEQARLSLTEIGDMAEPMRRTVSLRKGDYVLKTKVYRIDGEKRRMERRIKVSKDLSVTLNLR